VIERENEERRETKMAANDLKSVLRSIPKFDGKSNVDLFCSRCDSVLKSKQIDSQLLLLNFHLILEGEVQDWWKFTQIKFIKDLTDQNMDNRWTELKAALKLFYEPESVKKEARKAAKSVRFIDCSSAGEYVSKKLCHFGIMDPNMSDQKQVEKLIKGLPETLRNIMYCSEPKTPTEFLQKLRKMEKPEAKKPWTKSERPAEAGPSKKSEFSSKTTSGTEEKASSEKPRWSREDKRTCYNCRKPGHVIRNCPDKPQVKKEEQSSSVYGVSSDSIESIVESKND